MTKVKRGLGPSLLVCLLACIPVVLSGCGAKELERKMDGEHHVLQIWHLHLFFWEAHDRTPNDVEELKEWAMNLENIPYTLQQLGMKSIEDAFVSPRDKQPYVLRKISADQMRKTTEGGSQKVLAHEATGVDGKRFVAYAIGGGKELTAAEFKTQIKN